MKKVISFILLASLLLCSLLSVIPVMATTPDGTAVNNESDFLSMSASGKYYLSNDITIDSSYLNTFSGTLDGNGHKIKIAENANISPFKKIAGATFKNLTVEGVINIKSRTSYGGVAVEGYGRFENVTTKVGISAMVEDSFNSVGTSQGCFIAKATNNCSFVNCKNESSITVVTQGESAPTQGETGFGGFIGSASSASITFDKCFNNASVTSIEPRISVGGFVGASINTNLSFSSCDNTAIVIGGSSNNQHCGAGGFVGTVTGGSLTIKNCNNIADVQTYGSLGHTGGCVGRLSNVLNLRIEEFKNMRAIYNLTNGWEGVGGLIGMISDVAVGSTGTYIFKDCINSGWVNGSMAGGIVGIEYNAHSIDITFECCANTSIVKALSSSYAGGIIGRSNGSLRALKFIKCVNTGEITTNDGGYGVAGIIGNIGEEQHKALYSYTPYFNGCINMGNISCKTNITDTGNVVAAGIISRTPYLSATIKNCINLGNLSNSCVSTNVAHIAPKYNSINHSVSNCSYLSGASGAAVWSESSETLQNIRTDIVDILTDGLEPEAKYYNYRNNDSEINSVGEAVDTILAADTIAKIAEGAVQILINTPSLITISAKKDSLLDELGTPIDNSNKKYTEESYNTYITAFEKIKSDINAATTAPDIAAIDVSGLKKEAESKLALSSDALNLKKAELLAILGSKIDNNNNDYTSESYLAYSDTYLAIKNIIDNATDFSVLSVLDVKTLKEAAEIKLVKATNSSNDNSNTDNTGNTGNTNNTETTESETQNISDTENNEPSIKKCGSSIAISALAVTCIIGIAFISKKKADSEA